MRSPPRLNTLCKSRIFTSGSDMALLPLLKLTLHAHARSVGQLRRPVDDDELAGVDT